MSENPLKQRPVKQLGAVEVVIVPDDDSEARKFFTDEIVDGTRGNNVVMIPGGLYVRKGLWEYIGEVEGGHESAMAGVEELTKLNWGKDFTCVQPTSGSMAEPNKD